ESSPSVLRSRWSTPSSTFLPRKAHELTMENNMKLVRALGLAGIAAVSGTAAAADDNWYLGFGIGPSREKNHHDRITQELLGASCSAFARLGLQYHQAKDTFTGTGAVTVTNPSPSKSGAGYKAGLGVQYDFTPSLGLRGDWENYRVNDGVGNKGNINTYMVGLVYMFGAGKAAPRAEEPYVAPIAAAPVAEPVLVIVPIVAKTEQYCSILDIQFEINQKTVQHESEEKINKVGLFMNKYPKTTAVIEGHTDEVGSASDNMKLSERRAENVVNYLVDRSGIA